MMKAMAEHLDEFLKLVPRRRDEGKIQVMTMGELASHLEGSRESADNLGSNAL